jgi:CHRD domain
MAANRVSTQVAIGAALLLSSEMARAQSAATPPGAPAQGPTRAMGKPFSGRLAGISRDSAAPSSAGGSGMLYAVLDGKGKLAINGTFEGMSSPATVAHLHRAVQGQPETKVADLTVSKGVSGVIKGSVTLTEADIQELQKGACYVQIDSEQTPEGSLRGWLMTGMLK